MHYILLIMALAGPATAPASVPAIAPTTTPVRVDLSDPLLAFRTYAMAKRDGDGRAFVESVHQADAIDRRIVEALEQWVIDGGRLRRVATQHFRADTAEQIFRAFLGKPYLSDPHGVGKEILADLDRIEPSRVTVTGDEANLPGVSFGSWRAVRSNGKWRIDPTPPMGDAPQTDADGSVRVRYFRLCAGVFGSFADRIESGEFASADEAIRAARALADDSDQLQRLRRND